MREYETTIVLDPTLDDTRVNQEIEGVGNIISQGGGEVLEVWRWGRRRLAYEIRKRRDGIYTVIRFRSERGVLEELERRFRLNESLMRHQIVRSTGPIATPTSDERPGDGSYDRREGRHGERRHGHEEGRDVRRRPRDDDAADSGDEGDRGIDKHAEDDADDRDE